MGLGAELQRRQSLENRLLDFILAHPRRWLAWHELAAHGGQAWRSRLPAIREGLKAVDLEVQWNGKNGNLSAYMLRPTSLGRPAHEFVSQVGLF